MAIAAITDHFEGKKLDTSSVEQCISKGVFGRDRSILDDSRREIIQVQIKENTAIGTDNKQLKKRIPAVDFGFVEQTQNRNSGLLWPNVQSREEQKHEEQYRNAPTVVAPGQEEAHLQSLEQHDRAKMARTEQGEAMKEEKHETVVPADDAEQHVQTVQSAQVAQGNGNGWGGLFGMLGPDGIGNVTDSLDYVMTVLPDVLLGIFTDKTESLHLENSMLPIASIVADVFVYNPSLKALLAGLGGMDLLNKVGRETLKERTEGKLNITNKNDVQYRRYTNEVLNPHIVDPVLQDSTLIATIGRVPCTIQLSLIVAEAYRIRALPLSTLANAVLTKNDQLRQAAARSYEDGKLETIMRPRDVQQSYNQINDMEEKSQIEKKVEEKQVTLLSTALNEVSSAGGHQLDASGRGYPRLYPEGASVSAFNTLLMTLHFNENGCRTNQFTLPSDVKTQRALVRENERGIPFLFYNRNKYIHRSNPKQAISRDDCMKLYEEEQGLYKGIHSREVRTLFNTDQTTLPYVDKERHETTLRRYGNAMGGGYTEADNQRLHIQFSDFLLRM